MRKTLLVLSGLAIFATGAATGALAAPSTPTTPGAVVGQAGATAASKAAEAVKPHTMPAPKPVTLGAGTWQVGTEVKPGTYTTTAGSSCYWARLKGFDGELESIIANGNLDDGQRGRLTVKASDKGLELTGDCVWVRA